MSKARYKDIDFSIPSSVREAARKGLELRQEHGRGGSYGDEATARILTTHRRVNARKARHIAQYFLRHAAVGHSGSGPGDEAPSNAYIAWLLWGGDPGRSWSEALVRQLDQADRAAGVNSARKIPSRTERPRRGDGRRAKRKAQR
ncbi:hypothetical protein HNR42_002360 [Deinobacterium chartae]|uniref:Uncharacterized protein n=1 Tax=Deinobacterium chartae TaxID=521158 RepID=A0A841I4W4_9DEIO|nr:DNA-binding protein [Deinobacterium chartae]MBB6098925.1 hypothetical protein [Deinobacterium chartae]